MTSSSTMTLLAATRGNRQTPGTALSSLISSQPTESMLRTSGFAPARRWPMVTAFASAAMNSPSKSVRAEDGLPAVTSLQIHDHRWMRRYCFATGDHARADLAHVARCPGGRGTGRRRWSQEFDKDFVRTRQPSSRILISRTVNPPHGSPSTCSPLSSPSPLSVLPLPPPRSASRPARRRHRQRRHGGRPVFGRPAPARHQLRQPQSAINVAHHVCDALGRAWSPARSASSWSPITPASTRRALCSFTVDSAQSYCRQYVTRWPTARRWSARTTDGPHPEGSPIAHLGRCFDGVSARLGDQRNGQLIYPYFL